MSKNNKKTLETLEAIVASVGERLVEPWAEQAVPLLTLGWEPIPLPAGQKGPPPFGLTGAAGVVIEEGEILDFEEGSNVGVRLPKGVIGLDFDLYKDLGLLKRLQERFGALPSTFITSNAKSPLEGGFTAFYRVPEEFISVGNIEALDLIQNKHRYALVAPSLHTSGRRYSWRLLGAPQEPVGAPEVELLPELPLRWLEALRAPVREGLDDDYDNTDYGLEVLGDSSSGAGTSCAIVKGALRKHLSKLKQGGSTGSRHDLGVAAAWNLGMLRKAGHSGYAEVKEQYIKVFKEALASSGGRRERFREAEQLFSSAERKTGVPRRQCSCLTNGKGDHSNPLFPSKQRPPLSSRLFR